MSLSQHERAVAAAGAIGDLLTELFIDAGTSDAPDGWLLSAYRAAQDALIGKTDNQRAIRDTLRQLRSEVERGAHQAIHRAADAGVEQAGVMLDLYGFEAEEADTTAERAGVKAVLETYDAQMNRILILAWVGVEEGQILGSTGNVGLLSPGLVKAELARWSTASASATWDQVVGDTIYKQGNPLAYNKQVIAAIDHKTTETCLMAHAQAQPMDQPFRLQGRPRFADEINWTPFHNYCRTAVALVLAMDAEDDLTQTMRWASTRELEARVETGERALIWPSHARSSRYWEF